MDNHEVGTRIDLLTRSHRYCGLISTRGFRLSDILNDATSSVLELEDVRVTTKGVRPAELHSPRLQLRKQDVLGVFLAGEHEAPVRRSNNRVERRRHGVLIMLPELMISGIVHLPSRVMADTFLTVNSLLPAFLGLTNITIHSCTFRMSEEPYEVAIIRRDWIEALELSAELVPA